MSSRAVAVSLAFILSAPAAAQSMPPAFVGSQPLVAPQTGVGTSEVLRARHLLLAGDYAAAERQLADLLTRQRTPDVLRMAAVASLGTGNLALAERHFAAALSAQPRNAGTQAALGLVQLRLGKQAEAQAMLERLEDRQRSCAAACDRAAEIDQAVALLARALS